MSTAPIPQEPSIDESLSKLQVAQPASTQEVSSNPWQDNAESSESIQPSEDTVNAPDLSEFDPAAVSGFIPTPEPQPMPEPVKHEILEEFDPLVSSEEKAAKEAWETSEAHPPPPPPPPPEDSKPPPPVPTKQESLPEPLRSGSPIPSFPSLAALARTFALPLTGSRPRPRSLDTATAVPSPTTISSFASQQQLPRPPLTPPSQDNPDSGRSTPMSRSKSGEGEPLQFDFQRFLDQMKTKSADPVAKYLRSFLSNFAKRTFTVGDQVKLINDFLNFISVKMRECDVWKNASDAEFENAMEGMEKLVMNRLYDYTFTPQIARMVPPRPITADDLERDHILEQRIALFRWIEPNHLDIPDKHGREGFLMFAQQELLKINHYKAPRDKLICILNCCKVIFGLIRHLQREEGADSFIPILIYVVLKANPEHLLSNVEFINRFRNPTKLQSEAGYYLSSLMGAISFIETLDHTSLSHITEEEFTRNVEESIQSLPSSGSRTPDPNRPTTPSNASSSSTSLPQPSSHTGEESAEPLALPTPAQSQTLLSEDAKRLIQRTGDTISKPLAAIGRIFNEVLDSAEESLTALGGGQDGQRTPPYQTGDSSLAPGFSAQQPQPYQPRVRRIPSPNPIAGLPTPQWPPDDSYARQQRPSPPSAPYTNNALAMGPSQPMMTPHPRPVQNLVQSDREFQASLAASRASSSSIQSYTQSQSSSLSSLSAYGGEGMGVGRGTGVSRTPTPRLDIVGMQQEIDRVHENAAAAARETLGQIFPSMDREIVDLVLEANGGDVGKSVEALLEMSGGS